VLQKISAAKSAMLRPGHTISYRNQSEFSKNKLQIMAFFIANSSVESFGQSSVFHCFPSVCLMK